MRRRVGGMLPDAYRGAYLLALRCASWMTPGRERAEWLKEWASELWYVVNEAEGPSLQAHRQTSAFVYGAFQDAFWLGLEARRQEKRRRKAFSSPAHCLLLLLAMGIAAVALAFLLPGTRGYVLPWPYKDAHNLAFVSRDGHSKSLQPSVRMDEFRSWRSRARNVFAELAFYQMMRKRVHPERGAAVELSIARASGNLFDVLQIPLSIKAPLQMQKNIPRLVLSDRAWRKYFHADPDIAGQVVFVAGEKAIVTAIVTKNAWRLPGDAEAWLLETDSVIDTAPSSTKGYAIARMRPDFTRNADNGWHILSRNRDGGYDGFECVSVYERAREPFVLFAFAMMLAFLALPATTSLPLGEYPIHPRRQPWSIRLRRWLFLTMKLALVLPVVCFASLDVARPFASMQATTSEYIQLCVAFAGTLAALRWVLRDQRRRCPVCLQFLQNPVHVGQPSRSFLAWNGTELICVVGHGFLHVPELPTSWFSTQRWLYLDPSWKSLFQPQEMARTI